MTLRRLAQALLPSVIVSALSACGGSTLVIERLTIASMEDRAIRLSAELDQDLRSTMYSRHLFAFEYIVLEAPASADVTNAQLEEMETTAAETLREDNRTAFRGEVMLNPSAERVNDSISQGVAVMYPLEGADSPPFRYAILLPRHPSPERPELAHAFDKPVRYAVFLRIGGRVPTFGLFCIPSRPVDSHVRGVILNLSK